MQKNLPVVLRILVTIFAILDGGLKKLGRVVGDSSLRAFAMGKTNLQPDVGLSDPAQAALQKAAQRQMRCSKKPEKAEGLHLIFTPGLGQVVK